MHRCLWFSLFLFIPALALAQGAPRTPRVPTDRGVSWQAAPDLWLATSEGFRMFSVHAVHAQESDEEQMEIIVEATTNESSYDPTDLLGELVTVGVRTGPSSFRVRNAHVFRADSAAGIGPDGTEHVRVSLVLRPWLEALDMTASYATFENVTAVDVARAVFGRYPFARAEFRVRRALPIHRLVTQFRESDLQFVLRVLTDAGLDWTFEHDAHRHTLVVTDGGADRQRGRMPTFTHGEDSAQSFTLHSRGSDIRPTVARTFVRDPQHPDRVQVVEQRRRATAFGRLVISDHEATAPTRALARGMAARRLGAMRDRIVSVATRSLELEVGGAFAVRGHPRAALNGTYRAFRSQWMAERHGDQTSESAMHIHSNLHAVPLDAPLPRRSFYRSQHLGAQTATVIAPPAGPTMEGHVRVRFHWAPSPEGEMPSAWVPVHGAAQPRPGQEVLLQFLDGDPSRPVVWMPPSS